MNSAGTSDNLHASSRQGPSLGVIRCGKVWELLTPGCYSRRQHRHQSLSKDFRIARLPTANLTTFSRRRNDIPGSATANTVAGSTSLKQWVNYNETGSSSLEPHTAGRERANRSADRNKKLEVPVLILGINSLPDHIRRPGPAEEVVVLIRVRR